jgi:cyclic pyranopterin phosphate synthase
MSNWTHFDAEGLPRMVGVADKEETRRRARAVATVSMLPETLEAIEKGRVAKGDVFSVSTTAGILAAKQTPSLIPMCHPLRLTHISLSFCPTENRNGVKIESVIEDFDRPGVEIEALVPVSVAALTVIDMCKAIDKTLMIQSVMLQEKEGGRSGHFVRPDIPRA